LRDYELVLVLSPELREEEVPATVEKVKQFIVDRGGQINQVDIWGRRKLAYPIKHHLEGYYVVTQFQIEPQAVASVEANLRLTEEVLRHLVVRVEE